MMPPGQPECPRPKMPVPAQVALPAPPAAQDPMPSDSGPEGGEADAAARPGPIRERATRVDAQVALHGSDARSAPCSRRFRPSSELDLQAPHLDPGLWLMAVTLHATSAVKPSPVVRVFRATAPRCIGPGQPDESASSDDRHGRAATDDGHLGFMTVKVPKVGACLRTV